MKKEVSMMLATVLVLGLLAVPALAAEVPGSDGRLTASNESIGTTIYVSRDLEVNTTENTVYVYPVGTTFSWEDREETSEQFYMAPWQPCDHGQLLSAHKRRGRRGLCVRCAEL